jgi:cytochrome d ubiquinol oxidase subunit I
VIHLVPLLDLTLPSQAPQGSNIIAARAAIGVFFTAHILLAGLVSGAAELAPAIEFLGFMRQRRRYDALAHGMARFITYYFAVSSTVAILTMTVLLVGFWGHFWSVLVRITWWPLVIEAFAFIMQVTLAYLWYYTWDPLRNFKALHMAIGGLLAVASLIQVYMIDIVASYMLTPTAPNNPIRLALNPTSYPLTVHRTIGNLAYVGFAVAGFSAVKFLRAKTAEDRGFYDWAGSFGVLWGVSMTLFQPVVGYSYAKEIQLHTYASWYKMMRGSLSNVFLWQITLLGLMFLVAAFYFTRRLRRDGAPGYGLLRLMSAGLVIATLVAALPHHLAWTLDDVAAAGLDKPFWQGGLINPLGAMIPWKILALMAYTLLAIAAVTWYLRGLSGVRWGSAGRVEQRLLIVSTVLTVVMIITMAFIRENGRAPDLVAGHMRIEQQQDVVQPAPTPAR